MYPLHKYLPTPFGTYLLYIDNGPTRVKINKDKGELPSYQAVKDFGRRQQNATVKYEAFQKPGMGRATAPGATERQGGQSRLAAGKKQTYTPSSNMPNSIWSPKVKRPHLSYNMRQLWHTGQPMKDPPSTVVKVDEVTGAEVINGDQWTKDRFSKQHEGMKTSPSFREQRETNEPVQRSSLSLRTDEILRSKTSATEESKTDNVIKLQARKSKLKVPPNTAANSPELSEAYKRRASSLRNDMVPKMQRKPKRKQRISQSSHTKQRSESEQPRHKETQTSPLRFAKTSMEHSTGETFPRIPGYFSPPRSTSVPLESPISAQAHSKDPRTKSCVQKTGLPPILEGEAAVQDSKRLPKTVAVETDMWRRRVRRVQEFRSASPTFPIKSKGEFWDDISKARLAHTGNYGLLPFTWKDPLRNRFDDEQIKQQRATEVEKILPVITRMSSVPRVAPYRA